MACSVAGITSDANVLTNELRQIAQRYLLQYGESIPCERLVSWLCDIKQAYTQYGGKRPFGVSILYMGWDRHHGFQLYQSEPSGNYGGWKATCIGNNSSAAVSMLKQDYKEGQTNLEQALALSVKVLSKTLDMNKLTTDKCKLKKYFTLNSLFKNLYMCKINNVYIYIYISLFLFSVEIATLTRVNDKTKIRILSHAEVEKLIKNFEIEEENAKKEKEEKERKQQMEKERSKK